MGAIGGAERYLQGKMPAKSSIVRHFQGYRRGIWWARDEIRAQDGRQLGGCAAGGRGRRGSCVGDKEGGGGATWPWPGACRAARVVARLAAA